MIVAYFSPDVTLPIASALAAVFGFIVLVGRTPLRFGAKVFRSLMSPFRGAKRRAQSTADKSSRETTGRW